MAKTLTYDDLKVGDDVDVIVDEGTNQKVYEGKVIELIGPRYLIVIHCRYLDGFQLIFNITREGNMILSSGVTREYCHIRFRENEEARKNLDNLFRQISILCSEGLDAFQSIEEKRAIMNKIKDLSYESYLKSHPDHSWALNLKSPKN